MAVYLTAPHAEVILPVPGFRLGTAQAGIRKADHTDLTLLLLDPDVQVAGVFTQNRFCAAPVQICRQHLQGKGQGIRALLINTGIANAGTGEAGLQAARQSCAYVAELLDLQANQVLPFSTGVIMELLPVERIKSALPTALSDARPDHWLAAARAIMTTDTVPKVVSKQLQIDGQTVTITGMSKGSGMIHPNMATMLGFIATDACIAPELMQPLTQTLADHSFNCITVDGDTSTNDAMMLMASGQAAHAPVERLDSVGGRQLHQALQEVALHLAQAIVRDGEGASKFMTIRVEGGANVSECRQVASAIAHSPLVKTAFFASDPNLGRILAAVGYAGIDDLQPEKIDLWLGDVHVATQGARHPNYREEDGQRIMQRSEIDVRVNLGRGQAEARMWTCDFSYDYVRINADYRS